MNRLACVDVPALPLQLLLRRQPAWKRLPVVVVEHDKPQGIVLWVNESARAQRILPGMRYADALSLVPTLRAGVVPEDEICEQIACVCERLRHFTPNVEPGDNQAGVFWLDASGLTRLFRSLDTWAREIIAALHGMRFRARIVVGFTRYGTYALARTRTTPPDHLVFANTRDEEREMRAVPLARLDLDPALRDALHLLGIMSLGDFADLPANGVLRRFGPEALRLHRLVRNDLWSPLDAEPAPETIERSFDFERSESDLLRLMAVIERLVHEMLDLAVTRVLLVTRIDVQLRFESRAIRTEVLRPAAPTRTARVLLQLVHLRLDTVSLASGVDTVHVAFEAVREVHQQLDLFAAQPRRDRKAGNRALARLRAEFGDDVVVHAALRDGHLPEARFQWLRCETLRTPSPQRVPLPPLIRRLLPRPLGLPPRPRHEPDGWLIAGPVPGPVEEIVGPHVIAGGWWMRAVERAYYFLRTQNGTWLWVYEDRKRRRWFLHGQVE